MEMMISQGRFAQGKERNPIAVPLYSTRALGSHQATSDSEFSRYDVLNFILRPSKAWAWTQMNPDIRNSSGKGEYRMGKREEM